MTSDEAGFVRALRADPDDRNTQLVYADWLDDHDRPREAALERVLAEPQNDARRLAFADVCGAEGDVNRAEFVRVQVELAGLCHNGTEGDEGCPTCEKMAPLRIRERELLGTKGAFEWFLIPDLKIGIQGPKNTVSWVSCDRGIEIIPITVRRGFVESVTCSAEDWLEHGDAICERDPVTAVTLTTVPSLPVPLRLSRYMPYCCDIEVAGRVVRVSEESLCKLRVPWHEATELTVPFITAVIGNRWPRITFSLPPAFATADWGTPPANATPITDLLAWRDRLNAVPMVPLIGPTIADYLAAIEMWQQTNGARGYETQRVGRPSHNYPVHNIDHTCDPPSFRMTVADEVPEQSTFQIIRCERVVAGGVRFYAGRCDRCRVAYITGAIPSF